jgi:glutaredoxin
MCGASTVPNVFIGGMSVGGFTDGVEPLHAEGKLQGMLQAVGAA